MYQKSEKDVNESSIKFFGKLTNGFVLLYVSFVGVIYPIVNRGRLYNCPIFYTRFPYEPRLLFPALIAIMRIKPPTEMDYIGLWGW